MTYLVLLTFLAGGVVSSIEVKCPNATCVALRFVQSQESEHLIRFRVWRLPLYRKLPGGSNVWAPPADYQII